MKPELTPDRIEAAMEYINSQILAAARRRAANPDSVPSADVQALHCAYAALEAVMGRKSAEANQISENPVIALGLWDAWRFGKEKDVKKHHEYYTRWWPLPEWEGEYELPF